MKEAYPISSVLYYILCITLCANSSRTSNNIWGASPIVFVCCCCIYSFLLLIRMFSHRQMKGEMFTFFCFTVIFTHIFFFFLLPSLSLLLLNVLLIHFVIINLLHLFFCHICLDQEHMLHMQALDQRAQETNMEHWLNPHCYPRCDRNYGYPV